MARNFSAIVALALVVGYHFATQVIYDPKTIAGKRVLVTGASSGIGEQLAYHYSELGARLVLTARRADLLDKVAKRCRELGAKEVSLVPADMADPKDRIKVVAHTKKQLTGLDHLILNHAIMRNGSWQSTPKNLTNMQTDMNVNFFSYVDMASRLLPLLTESKGHLGVLSSVAGKVGWPLGTTYSAAKFAIQGFYSAWRQELNYRDAGVSVTLAVLGPISTETVVNIFNAAKPSFDFDLMTPTPKDAAEAIVKAVETRAYELHYGWISSVVLITLHKMMPQTVEYVLVNYILSG